MYCDYGRGSLIKFITILFPRDPTLNSKKKKIHFCIFNRTGAISRLKRKLPVILIIDLSFSHFSSKKCGIFSWFQLIKCKNVLLLFAVCNSK